MTQPNSGDFQQPNTPGPVPGQQPPQFGPPQGSPTPPQGGPMPQQGPGGPYGQGGPGPYGQDVPGGPQPPLGLEQPRKKKVSVRGIISIVVTVAVLGFAAFQWYSNSQRDQALTVGECVRVSGDADNVDVKAAGCDDDDSEGVMFYVISVHESSARCEEPMVEYYETQSSRRGGSERTTKTVCLGEVLHQDRCYEDFDGVSGLRGVECPGGYVEVTQVLDVADGECAADEFPLPYNEWPRTYCLAEV